MSGILGSFDRQSELIRIGLEQRGQNQSAATGCEMANQLDNNRQRIERILGASAGDWENWRWQLKNRINDAGLLARLLPLNQDVIDDIDELSKHLRWAVTPYYLSLIDPEQGESDPVFRQVIPSIAELNQHRGTEDPMQEAGCSPVAGVTRRYPDRLIINVTNRCASYCRHCQRRRYQLDPEKQIDMPALQQAINYIREHQEIRDVLITGGDALLISWRRLGYLLNELDTIPHVEIKRIGTRLPVFCPQRIDDTLINLLKKHHPIYLNTQFNHPREITKESAGACQRLADAGIVLGNQSVLLKGVNDSTTILRKLNQQLLTIRVRPYYLFQAKEVVGTTHFVVPINRGMEIAAGLRGYTSGLANPLYIVNAPEGQGKIPLVPEYYLGQSQGIIYFRTWQGQVVEYPIYGD
ncbi:MAG: KamA family radical SAM protein [Methylocystaceae bacterium]